MATIGNLALVLSVNAAAMASGLGRAQDRIKGFSTSTLKIFAGVGAALGGIFAVSAVKGYVLETIDEIDRIAKAADRVGTSTENFVGLEHAANLNGVAAAQLTQAMEFLNKTMGAATAGSAESRNAFSSLGLSFEHLATQDTGESFLQIADAIGQLSTTAEQANAAVKIFGRSGVGLLKVFQSHADLRKLIKESGGLGLGFSRKEAADVEAAKDALTRMEMIFTGIKRQLTIAVSPLITTFAEGFATAASNAGGFKEVFASMVHALAKGMITLLQVTDKLIVQFKKMDGLIGEGGTLSKVVTVGEFIGGIGLLKLADKKFGLGIQDAIFGPGVEKGSETLQSMIEGLNKFVDDYQKNVQKADSATKTLSLSLQQAAVQKGMEAAFGGAAEAIEKANDALDQMASKLIETSRSPLEIFRQSMSEMESLFAGGRIGEDVFARGAGKAVADLTSAIGAAQTTLPSLLEANTREAASLINRAQAGMGQETIPKLLLRAEKIEQEKLRVQKDQLKILRNLEQPAQANF